ncbi:MAG: hypothetical protein HN353_10885 [Bdellovibrionales bacterium]|nr:hypothetical protein [Bdellovibrionales bacterium]MBT3524800.1 hypothetical protein [Bdellovibrionales bacterium]MBT7668811.1 hypothetical protein [Bdellovibrionales bacterium]
MLKTATTFIYLALTLLGLACSDNPSYQLVNDQEQLLLKTQPTGQDSSSMLGNLVTTAIKEANGVDVVLFPQALVPKNHFALLTDNMSEFEIDFLYDLFPSGVNDQFLVGTIKGKDLKTLIMERSKELYQLEVESAGIEYHIHFVGGRVAYANFGNLAGQQQIKDDVRYRMAVSNVFFFSGKTFPGYRYRNSFNFRFNQEDGLISAKESLRSYLLSNPNLPELNRPRAKVTRETRGALAGVTPIAKIQGESHRSPLYGYQVTTQGVITALGAVEWYPGGVELYIQSTTSDNNPKTSEAVHLYLRSEELDLAIGDLVEVSGVVYEQVTKNGLSRTSMREISNIRTLKRSHPLPASTLLGEHGLAIPFKAVSTYRGDLNLKPSLNLADGIDYWESLEGMRISIRNPRVVGFRGGREEFENLRPKGYLTLYSVADGDLTTNPNLTSAGGLIIDHQNDDFNPELITISTNHFSRQLDTATVFNVGDLISGEVTGVLDYQLNLFGGGEFVLAPTGIQPALDNFIASKPNIVDLANRGRTTLVAADDKLTVATFNVENLAANQNRRIAELARAISINLACPDILNLVEIQDFNGIAFGGGPQGRRTLLKLINEISCPTAEYHLVNIDPVEGAEGGQPGGNIRVAMIYNASRVSFVPRGDNSDFAHATIYANGQLSHNPGRVFPEDPAFKRTRRSIVAEYNFRGERVFLIGNHFNSKLGDSDRWGAIQPFSSGSETRRLKVAQKINTFVQLLRQRVPRANIVVLGDFNALITEASLAVLAGQVLTNLISYGDLIPLQDRYTTNYNGNSQALDYIFAGNRLLNRSPELEVLHINSDFMGRISDHDPLIARFSF